MRCSRHDRTVYGKQRDRVHLEANGNSTQATWTMVGKNNFLGKIVSLFFDMDHMIGKDFEPGLTDLKIILEK